MSDHAIHPVSGRIVLKEDFVDRSHLDDSPAPRRTDNIRQQFRKTMETIREAYAAKRKVLPDDAAFEALVQERGIYEAGRWPLAHVTNALVRISPKAQRLNGTVFAGRFR